ncbi:MAG: hypothetical protein B1H06_00670 [Candidatus Cloacimonas sp. 4484_143]|nr:MAG: hypothetical protein B1H06_00670 [Candidatus Cloacimonas sp. 4484_143]
MSGAISEDTFWNADTVKVIGNIQVLPGATLIIPAGVKVEFQDFYSLQIQGSIQALGEADNLIHFTSAQSEFFSLDHSIDGAWNGIRFINTSYSGQSSILQYCIIEYSKNVDENGVGAAISCFDFSDLKIENCIFQSNVADYGGAISLEFNSNPMIINNIFSGNYAFLGGSPIYCTYSYPRIINNTIIENQVLNEDIFVSTGAIHTFQAKPQVYNNIIWENEDYFFEESPLLFCKPFYVEHNDIEFGFEGVGNIDADPEFANQIENDFSLLSNSPCIDSGITELPWNNEVAEFDLLGNPRVTGSQIDMGAFEYISTITTNDQLPMSSDQLINFPNPFNPSTTISFTSNPEIPENTELVIYSLKGQKVKTLRVVLSDAQHLIEGYGKINSITSRPSTELRMTQAGSNTYSVVWNGTNDSNQSVASGIYFAKVKVGDRTFTRKMLLMK